MQVDAKKIRDSIFTANKLVRDLTAAHFEITGTIPALLSSASFPELPQKHLKKCKVYSNRYIPLETHWPKNSKILEVGTQTGEFANHIFQTLEPEELHTIDISYALFHTDLQCSDAITKHEGMSSNVMREFEDSYFDIAYIDASHDYQDVKNDILEAKRIVKDKGLIVCNDYVWYSPAEMCEYGVIRAVNESVIENKFDVSYMALHVQGFFDIALINRK